MREGDLRILLLEDTPADAALLEMELRRGGLSFTLRVADTREGFARELERFHPDVILSDYSLPAFDGLSALYMVRERHRDMPYIFVSGSIGEDRAVEALQLGATDYIMKGRYARLVPSIRRAMAAIREREELMRVEQRLIQTQKLQAIGQLAGGIAHDFNNLLTIINGYAELLLTRPYEEESLRSGLTEIRSAGKKAASLTRQLLAFGRKQVIQPRVLDLNTVVAEMGKLLRRVIGEDIALSIVLAPDLGPVKADPGQIEQILMNLAVNARDAMPAGGQVVIQTGNAHLGGTEGGGIVDVVEGSYVRLSVRDTGTGMDEATRARIFEPFFTTKEQGRGTGLGLATVYGIVKQHGGYIFAESSPGTGTTMNVYFPRVEEPVEAPATPAPAQLPQGTETILVVEDEESVRIMIGAILQSAGYTVLSAGTGEEALRIVESEKGPIALVMSDVVMPRMNGKEATDRIRLLRPGIKVLLLSGYPGTAIAQHGVLERDIAFLEKPCAPEALARKVREVLDS